MFKIPILGGLKAGMSKKFFFSNKKIFDLTFFLLVGIFYIYLEYAFTKNFLLHIDLTKISQKVFFHPSHLEKFITPVCNMRMYP